MVSTQKKKRAVLYCRVSSKKQTIDGSGLDSQEHRCRAYAEARGYEVEAVFPDDMTAEGDFIRRPGMVALLAYLDAKPDENFIVIFDDLKRYARDTEFHLKLKREMNARNAVRECFNFKFDDSPEGEFIETIMAAQGELERKQNRRQVIQKMKARVEQGFWVFRAPIGYRYEKSEYGGKQLVRDEPVASIIEEAMRGFASGRFQTQVEVQRFLEGQPLFPKDFPNGAIRAFSVTRLLKRPVYSGYVCAPKWGVSLRKGRHEPIIPLRIFEVIQERLATGGYAPTRKDISEDFVLRGFVTCAECAHPLTSCYSKSKSGRLYPYYRCHDKSCASYGKSIPRAKIESAFNDVVRSLQPTQPLLTLAKAMFKSAWDQRSAQRAQIAKLFGDEIKLVEKQIDQFLERIMKTDNQTVVSAYESKIAELEKSKLVAQERLENADRKPHTFSQMFEHAMMFIANPWKLWNSGDFHLRRTVLKLAFTDRVSYSREKGFLNTQKSLVFKVLEGLAQPESKMVPRGRIELPASPLPRVRSTTELPRLDHWSGHTALKPEEFG